MGANNAVIRVCDHFLVLKWLEIDEFFYRLVSCSHEPQQLDLFTIPTILHFLVAGLHPSIGRHHGLS